MHIIDECKLVSMALVAAPADKDLIIRRVIKSWDEKELVLFLL